MPVIMVQDIPGGTREQYDEVCARLNDGRALSALGDWPVEGILAHASGPIEGGWRVVDVWESEQAFERFGEVIGPILQEVGVGGEPRVAPLHNFVK